MNIVGVSAFYHDSAAVLLVNGDIIAAAQEERFSRKKHDKRFPENALRYVLKQGNISVKDVDIVVFYESPDLKIHRLVDTFSYFYTSGKDSFVGAMHEMSSQSFDLAKMLRGFFSSSQTQFFCSEHHLSHAASAFYPSPFKKAAILTMDGVGEWATTTIGKGENSDISILLQQNFPHSLGLFYSAFTSYCGFRVNSGEYKLMGLAPYGNKMGHFSEFKKKILEEMISLNSDGSFFLNLDYFNFQFGFKMCNSPLWEKLFGFCERAPEDVIKQEYMDLALAIQSVTEDIVFSLALRACRESQSRNLVLAGGVALNCVANGRLLSSGIFDDIWIQPAAGDAGGALGAALAAWHICLKKDRQVARTTPDSMSGSYLGPEYGEKEVLDLCQKYNAPSIKYDNFDVLCDVVADILANGNVVGWHQGRMEWGPRALGNRSILGDARNPDMQKKLNLKIKYREGFRPFAPSVLAEDAKRYFITEHFSPYMLLVFPVLEARRKELPDGYDAFPLLEKLYFLRSDIPAITHVDYSARVQTVHKETNERYWKLINAFKHKTGYGIIVNTSFNVRGEPIVCSPDDAYRCFMRTEIDYLVIGDHLFKKNDQPAWPEGKEWQFDFVLD